MLEGIDFEASRDILGKPAKGVPQAERTQPAQAVPDRLASRAAFRP